MQEPWNTMLQYGGPTVALVAIVGWSLYKLGFRFPKKETVPFNVHIASDSRIFTILDTQTKSIDQLTKALSDLAKIQNQQEEDQRRLSENQTRVLEMNEKFIDVFGEIGFNVKSLLDRQTTREYMVGVENRIIRSIERH